MTERARISDFFTRASREQVSLVTRRLGLSVLSGVVLRTPVDTGRARANWQVGLGLTERGTDEAAFDKAGSATIAAGGAVMAGQKGFQPISITNSVPYIGRLNDGSSQQAPAGYVESTLAGLGLETGRD